MRISGWSSDVCSSDLDLVEISSDFAWETGPTGQFVFVSTAGAFGYDPDELVGRLPDRFLVVPDGLAIVSPFDTREPVRGVEVRFRRSDGDVAVREASAAQTGRAPCGESV